MNQARLKTLRGFTLIELIAVIVVLGIVATVALGKFEGLSEDAHNAAAKGAHSQFSSVSALTVYNYVIERDADPTTVEVRPGVTLPVNAQGWPGNPYNGPTCLTLWQTIMTSSEPMNPLGTVPFGTTAPGWEYFGNGLSCLYFYKPDVTPFRLIQYLPDTGAPGTGWVRGINI